MAVRDNSTNMQSRSRVNRNKNECILQWNMRGMGTQGDELKILAQDLNPIAIFLQETKSDVNDLIKIKGYQPVPYSQEAYGIAIYIRIATPHSLIHLVTPLRAVAVKVTINNKVYSMCSIHITDDSDYSLKQVDLTNLKSQLPGSLLL